MRHITLDCTLMTDEKSVHDVFSQGMAFPAHYGRNLDALYDMLTSCGETKLTLVNADALKKLFRYGDNLLLAIQDADKDNHLLELEIIE